MAVGDVVLVRAGEVIPVDGIVVAGEAVVDESALTGEPLPVTYSQGGAVRSGTTNAGDAFEARAVRPASESAYAALVRLVRQVESERAPFVRLADRYAIVFLPVTALVAALAWAISGDPVRALAVFVVATPCPLILAAPVALISGVSRAARAGVIVKGAGVIERLGDVSTVLLDKTGTLSLSATPEVERVVPLDGIDSDELLRLAASLDQLSAHALAEALVHDAERKGFVLDFPESVEERLGQGIEGTVDGHRVAVGSASWLEERGYGADPYAAARSLDDEARAGSAKVLVGVNGAVVGGIVMGDHLRADAPALITSLRDAGIRHVAIVTGDRAEVADEVGAQLGVDEVYAEHTPEEKVDVVRSMQRSPELRPVLMVGDGINDAPALALADVGIAMGVAGATAASETADAVIVLDRVDRVGGRRAHRTPVAPHRPAERPRRDGLERSRDVLRRLRPHHAGVRRAAPGGDRRSRHPQRPARPPRLSSRRVPTGPAGPVGPSRWRRTFYATCSISIFRGSVPGIFGAWISSTPPSNFAATCSVSASTGSWKRRSNARASRS